MTFSVSAPTNNTGALLLNGTEVLSIDSSGNLTAPNSLTVTGTVTQTGNATFNGSVGIGTSSPIGNLDIKGTNPIVKIIENTGTGNAKLQLLDTNNASSPSEGTELWYESSTGHSYLTSIYSGGHFIFSTANAERMRINSSGQLIHNGTSTFGYGGTVFFHSGAGGRTMNTYIGSGTLQSLAMWVGGTERGYINSDSGGTTYNTTSDYRLKENVQPILEPINKVKLLKPCTWTWVDDNESNGIGFIAHELAEVVPTAVSGVKDETETYTDENGVEQTRPKYQGVDQSRIVGLLTSALQEAITKIEDLETRIQALESN